MSKNTNQTMYRNTLILLGIITPDQSNVDFNQDLSDWISSNSTMDENNDNLPPRNGKSKFPMKDNNSFNHSKYNKINNKSKRRYYDRQGSNHGKTRTNINV